MDRYKFEISLKLFQLLYQVSNMLEDYLVASFYHSACVAVTWGEASLPWFPSNCKSCLSFDTGSWQNKLEGISVEFFCTLFSEAFIFCTGFTKSIKT